MKGHGMVNYISGLVFVILLLVGGAIVAPMAQTHPGLVEREQIAKAIESHVVKDTKGWGLEVTGLRIQDIDMPEELKRMMSRQASAEREKRANITKAEGDKEASINLAAAARTMAESPG